MTSLRSPSFDWKRQNPPKSHGFDWEMYRYTPTLIGATISLVIFIALALLHTYQFLKLRNRIIIFIIIGALSTKKKYRMANTPFIVGEVGGYGARIALHYDNQAWAPYITQGVLTLIGPLWFAATIYMLLGRTVILAGGEEVSFIKPKFFTWGFVGADIATLVIQGLGSSIMGTMKLELAIAGEKIVIAGLALQVATFVVFLGAALDFQGRMRGKPRATAASAAVPGEPLPVWLKTLYILYSVSALILFRCTFRLIEYSMGNAAYLIAHEWTLYCFDTVPMVLVLVLLAVLRPSQYVEQGRGKAEVDSDGEMGLEEENIGFVSKKPHSKSRGGCLTCKRKKVKCDETQPVCGYCTSRRLKCEYLPDFRPTSKTTWSISTPSHEHPSFKSSITNSTEFNTPSFEWLIPPFQTSIGDLTPLDHHLLQHYKTNVWHDFAISDDIVIKTLHTDIVPSLSISHPFLLYALLSVAATHSNTQNPNPAVATQALVYRQKTFEYYQLALKDITPANYEAVLVTGTLLLALIPPPVSDQDSEYLEWMLALLKLSEGLRILASLRWGKGIEKLAVYPLVRRELRVLPPPPSDIAHTERVGVVVPPGPPGSTFVNPAPTYTRLQHPEQTHLFLPPLLMALLQNILQVESSGPVEDWHRAALIPIFHILSPIFTSLYYWHLNPDFYVRVFVFTSFLMPEFLELVREGEPRALVLVAWWFALADLVPRGWWVGDKMAKVVGAIGRAIGKGNHELAERVFTGAQSIVDIFERDGREAAAKSIFEGWHGVDWEEGPGRAAEWGDYFHHA
ncbi:rta1 domain-containing [Pyrenophora seminiperda CCB06]|uniref:Rta1 domain-containing n=1 Tax=Pyrenophora seminiperda CCB06 TaxID=1302712 RepID=A0A3M7M9S5_9PLEO|nr:rta1 domain-containing [Pyrenophora seminiperda CCB06]